MDHLMRDTIELFGNPSYNRYGQIDTSSTDSTTETVRFREHIKMVRDNKGSIVQSDAQMYVNRTVQTWIGQRLTYNGYTYEIIDMINAKNEGRTQFVYCLLRKINVT